MRLDRLPRADQANTLFDSLLAHQFLPLPCAGLTIYVAASERAPFLDFSQTVSAFRDKLSFAAAAVSFAIVSTNRCAGTEDLFPDYLRFRCLR